MLKDYSMSFFNSTRMRNSLLVLIGTAVAAGMFLLIRTPNSAKSNKNCLTIGMLPADAPFYSINENGQAEGFDVDVARAVAERMGKDFVFKELGVPELFIALQTGKIDMFLCGLSITTKRLEKIAMV